MTTIDRLSLLDAMDVVTDLLSNSPNYSEADDQLVFRKLQKQLSPEQFQCLFAELQEHYAAKCAQTIGRPRDRP